jgi:Glycerol kinase
MQFQADILNTEVDRAAEEETTALGAAFLAGLAVDYWHNTDELRDVLDDGKLFKPAMAESKRHRLYRGWQNAVSATQMFKPASQD